MRCPPLAFALLVLVVCAPTAAAAYDKRACVDASEQAQDLKKAGRFTEAREKLAICIDPSCPGPVRTACAEWLTTIEQAQPTVIVSARDAQGSDVPSVRVTVDGKPFAERLDGRALPIDPGVHVFRFESGAGTTEQEVVVREGETRRAVSITFPAPAAAATGTPGPAGAPAPASSAPTSSSGAEAPRTERAPVPTVAWISGGIGVAALATFGVFAAMGASERSDVKDRCYGHCTQADIDAAQTKLLVADVSLGVAVVALGVATYFTLTRGNVTRSAAARPNVLFAF